MTRQFTTITRTGTIAHVRFDRGDGLNALSVAAMEELCDVARELQGDVDTHVVVLSGTDKAFSAGADLKDPAWRERDSAGLLKRRHLLKLGPDMCQLWESLEQVVICAVEGFCIGGGMALAIACDLRVAGRGAHFRLPEVPLGMNMSWQSNPRLVNLVGPARAKQIVILGEAVQTAEALGWGLIEDVTDDGKALTVAMNYAQRFASVPPLPLRMSKQAINAAANALNFATSYMDRDQYALTQESADREEAIRAFLEKRTPRFTGE